MEFLDGDHDPVLQRLEAQMAAAAAELEFEQAARIRDRLATVRRAIERQQMVGDRNEDVDVIGNAEDELEAAAQVFFVRKGRVVGRFGFVLDKVMDLTPDQTMASVLEQIYGDEPAVGYPKAVLVPTLPEDLDIYTEWLSTGGGVGSRSGCPSAAPNGAGRHGHPKRERGVPPAPVEALVRPQLPGQGAQNDLETAPGPARLAVADRVLRHEPPPGTDYVGSMVVLEDGLPRKSEYRPVQGQRARQRRLRRHGRGAHPPDLTRLPGRTAIAPPRIGASSPTRRSCCWSTAARGNSVWRSGARPVGSARRDPGGLAGQAVRRGLPAGTPRIRGDPTWLRGAVFLLQRIRRRVAPIRISYHRQLRGKRMTRSASTTSPALGEVRKQRLVKELGGVRAVKAAELEDLQALTWLPDSVCAGRPTTSCTARPERPCAADPRGVPR